MPYTNANLKHLVFHISQFSSDVPDRSFQYTRNAQPALSSLNASGYLVRAWDERLPDKPPEGHYSYKFCFGEFDDASQPLTREKANQLAIEKIKRVGQVVDLSQIRGDKHWQSEPFVFLFEDEPPLPPLIYYKQGNCLYRLNNEIELERDFYPVYALVVRVPLTKSLDWSIEMLSVLDQNANQRRKEARREVLSMLIGESTLKALEAFKWLVGNRSGGG